MQRLIVLLNLKPGKSAGDYEAWARATDLPTVNSLASVDHFEVFRSTGVLGSEQPPPYQYVEIIDVNDMARFGDEVGTDRMKHIAAEFQAWADPVFITVASIE